VKGFISQDSIRIYYFYLSPNVSEVYKGVHNFLISLFEFTQLKFVEKIPPREGKIGSVSQEILRLV
jgi:hypothetical protein